MVPRSQFSGGVGRKDGHFRNRERQLAQIGAHLDALTKDPDHLKVLEVVGIGGAGKSRLLRYVRQGCEGLSPHVVSVSLEEEGSTTEIGPLIEIRRQLGTECLLFDTALLAFGRASGQRFPKAQSEGLSSSIVVKALETANSVGGFLPVLPLGSAIEVFRRLRKSGIKLTRYTPEQFEDIDSFGNDSRAIRERLPHWLGLDLRQSPKVARQLIAFYDGYDRQSRQTRRAKALWLREFIATVDHGVHLISSRDELCWDADEWGEAIETVRVEELPETEAARMIRSALGKIPPGHRDRLLKASGRFPFALNAFIEVYKQARARGPVDVRDLPSSPNGAYKDLINHLEAEEQELAAALATIQVFDEGIYAELVHRLSLNTSLLRFDEFLDWFFVEEISPGGDDLAVHKTHDLLTAYVRDAPQLERGRRRCLQAATEALLLRCGDGSRGSARGVLLVLRAIIAGWESVEEMPVSAVETLIDAVYLLYDAGYWNALALIVSDADRESPTTIASVSSFVDALVARRIDGISTGIRKFEQLAGRADDLGRHRRSIELELGYLREISGDYSGARIQFRLLSEATAEFDPADRTQRRSRMYHADMLIQDGLFPEAARLFQETYEQLGVGAIIDKGEMMRLRAHAYRFSFMFERAVELYLDAMDTATEAPGLRAKLHSNLAEACCWYDPRRALDEAELSIELNRALDNEIEIAKCEAARCIALAKLGNLEEGLASSRDSRLRAAAVGYPAGEAFALQAAAVAAGLAGEADIAQAKSRELAAEVRRLDTYSHLLVAPRWLLGQTAEFEKLAVGARWFDPAGLDERLAACLTLVGDRARDLD